MILPTSSMFAFPVPMSENDPRVPVMRAKAFGLFASNVALGFVNCGCLNGKLFPSMRIWNFNRSRIAQVLASETCVQFNPGPMNVSRPRLPTVYAAGYANEL